MAAVPIAIGAGISQSEASTVLRFNIALISSTVYRVGFT